MTTNRPYRKAPGKERAISCLLQERGSQFDPAVVDAFVETLQAGWRERQSGIFAVSSLVRRSGTAAPGTGSRTRSDGA